MLAEVLAEIRAVCGYAVRGEIQGDTLVLVFSNSEATVGVTVDDDSLPSFSVTYPGFDHDAISWRELKELSGRAVLLAGVLWIVRAVARDGAVLPEFPNAALRRRARRT